jgi:hypothetical protein
MFVKIMLGCLEVLLFFQSKISPKIGPKLASKPDPKLAQNQSENRPKIGLLDFWRGPSSRPIHLEKTMFRMK